MPLPSRRLVCLLVSLFLLSMTAGARVGAQPMADRVPAEAMVYVGWAGAGDATPGFKGSKLEGLMEATDLWGRVDRLLGALLMEPQLRGDGRQVVEGLRAVGPVVYQRPRAFYMTQPDFERLDTQGNPTFQLGIILDAGDAAGNVEPHLRTIYELIVEEKGADAVTFTNQGGVFSIILGPPAGEANITTNEAYRGAMAGVGGGGGGEGGGSALIIYVDGQRLNGFIASSVYKSVLEWERMMQQWAMEDVVNHGHDDGMQPQRAEREPPEIVADKARKEYIKARDAFGMDGVRSILFTGDFLPDGNFRTRGFVAAPAPRKGALALYVDHEPGVTEALKLVPPTATWFRVGKYNPTDAKTVWLDAMQEIAPNELQSMRDQAARLKREMGFDPFTSLVEPLGDTWVLYCDPATGSPLGPGLVVVHPIKDDVALSLGLAQMQAWAGQELQRENTGVAISTADMGEMQIHSLALPVPMPSFSPSWTVTGGRLIVSLNPQDVLLAVDAAGDEAGAMDNKRIAAAFARLGEGPRDGVGYTDLEAVATTLYFPVSNGLALLSQQTGSNPAIAERVRDLLPPLNTITPHLTPTSDRFWHDDAGWHYEAVGPFPWANVLGPDALPIAVPLGLSIGWQQSSPFREDVGETKRIDVQYAKPPMMNPPPTP